MYASPTLTNTNIKSINFNNIITTSLRFPLKEILKYNSDQNQVHEASTSTIGITQFFYIRILGLFWAPLPIFGLQYFFQKIKFRVEVLA